MSEQLEKKDSNLSTLRDNVNQLESRFEKLREDVISKLNECSDCIKSAKQLCQEATETTTILENKLTNASNEEKEWKDIKIKLATTSIQGKVILDVGGEKYTTSVEVLTREKDTFFTALFSKQWQLERDPDDKNILMGTLFPNETLLKFEHKKKLNDFYGKTNQQWELIYKATRDGFDANTFHSHCNDKGPTITIIQSNNNYLFGGYTAIPWTSDNSYKSDTTAFLFTLINPHNIPPAKYLIDTSKTVYTVNHTSGYGPTFGGGHDIHLAHANDANNSSYTNFPYTYLDTTGKGNNTFTGARNFTTSDIEVFKLA
ncbi:unnamed protein product [Rotaria socialis]|uniref:TLDc domain-containing protein n=1 Tax=Rotaria socialis TaxID=392032 RepID=A0A821P6I0_9BILA|nr:unnamed protein product [Rotaria socialis]CAF4799547.1 unnamed protein product [Rotaria socialis]